MTIDFKSLKNFSNLPTIAIDFEYQDHSNADLLVICAAVYNQETDSTRFYDLDPMGLIHGEFIHDMKMIQDSHILLAWNVVAEARSFLSLGLDPMKYNWVDLMVEWKMFRNGLPKYSRPRVGVSPDSLLNATKVFLGHSVNKEEKDVMRDFILSLDPENPWEELNEFYGWDELKKYCEGDIKDLTLFDSKFRDFFHPQGSSSPLRTRRHQLDAGKYMAATAVLERRGTPIDYSYLIKRTLDYEKDKKAMQMKFYPKMSRLLEAKKKGDMDDPEKILTFKRGILREEVDRLALQYEWKLGKMTTKQRERYEAGEITYEQACGWTGEAAMLEYALKVHKIKSDIITPEVVEYLKAENEFKFFSPPRKGFRGWQDYVSGEDGHIRPNLNPFGSSTFRNYPPAKGFLPANHPAAASGIDIPDGMSMIEMDYGQEEFIINGVLSGDEAIIEDYMTGDPYVALATRAGAWDRRAGTRHIFKQTVLGLGFGMMPKAFLWELRFSTMTNVTQEKADMLYDIYWNSYYQYRQYRETLSYLKETISLPDGTLRHYFPGQSNLSWCNFPTQASGGVVLRKATIGAIEAGIDVRFPFHDALYFFSLDEEVPFEIEKMRVVMQKAWKDTFPEAPDIKISATVYSKVKPEIDFCSVPTEWKEKYQGRV